MKPDFQLSEFLPYLLNQAAERASLDFAAVYRERFGLHRTDWRVLAHLGEFGEMSAREICDRASEHKTRVSRSVSRLVDLGYVTRQPSPADRRLEDLSLTLRGESVYRELTRLAKKQNDQLARSLGAENAKALKTTLLNIAQFRQK